jgi:hypothetical protein
MVIEVYDPNPENQLKIANDIKDILKKADFIVDVDSYITEPQPKLSLPVKRQIATLNGISSEEIARTISMAVYGYELDTVHTDFDYEPVDIKLRIEESKRKNLQFLNDMKLFSPSGMPVSMEKLVDRKQGTELEFVIMVIAVSCVKLLSAHNSTQHTSRKHKV